MALNSRRWLMAAIVGCALLTAGLVSAKPSPAADHVVDSPEVQHLRRVERRTFDAARRFQSRARADSVIASLPAPGASNSRMPRIVVDPLLPETHRLIAHRSVERQWRRLHIDSALIPVTVAFVIDTATAADDAPNSRRGEMAFDYVLATGGNPSRTRRGCMVIVAIQMHRVARPEGRRTLASWLNSTRRGDALLGPCAFEARFGVPGPGVDAWLRARSYDLAFSADWQEPERAEPGMRLSGAEDYTPAEVWTMMSRQLSPEAQACAAGALDRCDATLQPAIGARPLAPGSLVTRLLPREQHWGGLTTRYLSDLVTTIGPERFGRFWRSGLSPDAALRAAAGMSVSAWTHQWAVSLVGQPRRGPGLAIREVLGAALLATFCLAITVWGFGRRQVR